MSRALRSTPEPLALGCNGATAHDRRPTLVLYRSVRHLGPIGLLVALAALAQRSLLAGAATHVYAQNLPGNDSLLHVWTLAWDHHALATPARLFDANIFFPQPDTLLYSDHLLGLALLLAPLRWFSDNAVLAHNVALLAAPALNAIAMYALAFELTSGRMAALVAAVMYAFPPMRFETDRSQVQMMAAWWLPLMLLWGRRAVATGSGVAAVLAGVALAFQGLTGIYLTLFFAPALLLAHAVWLRHYPLRAHARGWAMLLAAESAATIVQLPFAIGYRRVQLALGTVRSPVMSAILSVPFARLPQYWPLGVLGAAALALTLWRRRLPSELRRQLPLFAIMLAGGILLAQGPAIGLPFDLGTVRGPYAALVRLPGFDALRAPGRMLHIALVGAAVLAAAGVTAATRGRPPWVRRAVGALALVAATFECATPAFPVSPVPPPASLDPAYDWLARADDHVRVVELPLGLDLGLEQLFQYASTAHWRPIVNGTMGVLPPVHEHMAAALAQGPTPRAVAELRALGVTHLVAHELSMPPAVRNGVRDAARATPPLLVERARSPQSVVYELADHVPLTPLVATGRPLPSDHWRVTASENAEDAALAVDGRDDTAWHAWGGLERDLMRWWHPLPFFTRWDAFIARQPTQLEVSLPEATTITAVLVRLGGSDPMAIPMIRVATSLDGTTWDPVPGFLAPAPDARVLIANAPSATHVLVLPAGRVARFVRFECKGLDWFVHEIELHGA